MLVQQVAQRSHRHLQKFSSGSLISLSATQSFEQVGFFQLIQMRCQMKAVGGELKLGINSGLVVVGDLRGQAFRLDRVGLFQRHCSFDRVLQFAHVARPRIRFEQAHGPVAYRNCVTCLGGILPDEVLSEFGDVCAALS